MNIWERFQRLEVLKKQLEVKTQKTKQYLTVKKGKTVKDLGKFVALYILYGIIVNLALYLILKIDISILNILASGGIYYLFVDVVDILSEKKFILFRGNKEA